ncbi:Rox3-domain-containing protein [Rhizodiscina lignyota]|uniref:Mediator of RNA polymerase II transcription subunit 19 n=1 Tax=Rhizodiscina lignyota TaxID=1504668 RepID=A0A9P4I7D5_9PEZI|nr:Rox3-domain-containing protein [Rhizodiscina lignyota]
MSAYKRPRLTGSFSPASPPYHLAKGVEQKERPVQQPNTPTSPPPTMSAQVIPGLSMSGPSASTASAASTVNTQLADDTPASSAAGTVSFAPQDRDGDAVMGDGGEKVEGEDGDKKSNHMRTDHERIQEGLKLVGEQEALRDYLLNVDVGPMYKLCEKQYTRSVPHPSQNLITLFNLTDIAKSVERKDPVTGEKTNKLRKSYENQIKTLAIAGRNKAIDGNGDFQTLLKFPDEEYFNQHVNGKSVESGLTASWEARLDKALAMPVPQIKLPEPENERWKSLIGTEEPVKLARPLVQGHDSSTTAPAVGSKQQNASGRPERANKKRRYNDSSFAGYGEGYLDDHLDSEDDTSLAARRKRVRS